MSKSPDPSVSAAIRAELAEIRKSKPEVADSGLAASALRVARAMDDEGLSATAAASCARAIHDTMVELYARLPDEKRRSRLDELGARRASRRAGVSGS